MGFHKERCNALCRVLLDSFISTQKLSVQKTLQRKFKRFVSYKRDFQELLLSALQGLVREQIRYEACSGPASAAEPVVSIPMKQVSLAQTSCTLHLQRYCSKSTRDIGTHRTSARIPVTHAAGIDARLWPMMPVCCLYNRRQRIWKLCIIFNSCCASHRSLEERAREYNITDLQGLYNSQAFRSAGFSLDQQHQIITLPR